MPSMGVGVYFAASALAWGGAVFAGFEDFAGFFAVPLLRAADFFAFGRFFMPRTLQPARVSVNAPADAAARR
jgi:hypothetical protein